MSKEARGRGNPGAASRFTPRRREQFLTELAARGNVRDACVAVDISRVSAYNLRAKDREFAEQWESALEAAADTLEREAWRRAHDGVESMLFGKEGEGIATRKYSDTLLIFLLKGIRPAKYKDRHQISGDKDNPVSVDMSVRFVEPPDASSD